MSEHDISLPPGQPAVDDLLRKVAVLKETRPRVYADVVHPGVAAAVTDPAKAKNARENQALKSDFERL